jgi:hypothetical protein
VAFGRFLESLVPASPVAGRYTSHGHWVGPGEPTQPPDLVARCGGPAICAQCAREAAPVMAL